MRGTIQDIWRYRLRREHCLRRLGAVRNLQILLGCCCFALFGCASSPSDTVAVTASSTFAAAYDPVDTIVPQQTSAHLVARIADVEFRSDGVFLIVDDSEGDVKLFAPDGRLIRVIGRKGEGPGEFAGPRRAAFGPDGRIYVLDPNLNRLQVFGRDGEFQRVVVFDSFVNVRGFNMLSDGTFLFLVARLPNSNVLIHTDTLGTIQSRYLPIGSTVPPGQRDGPEWVYPRTFFMAVRNDTAFVVSSVLNRLWMVAFPRGTVRSIGLDFPGYDAPRLPPPSKHIDTGPEMIDWFLHRDLTGFIEATPAELWIPFIKGRLLHHASMVVLLRSGGHTWMRIDDAPPIVATSGRRLVAVEHPATNDMRFIIYAPSGGE